MIPAWLGWAILPLIAAAIYYAYVRIRYRQAQPPTVYAIRLDDFAAVHFPITLPRAEAQRITEALRAVYRQLWPRLGEIYGHIQSPGVHITDIAIVDRVVEADHPHIVWHAPSRRITARLQETLPLWFAAELHNVYRYQLYGIARIYLSDYDPTDDERRMYREAMQFISSFRKGG